MSKLLNNLFRCYTISRIDIDFHMLMQSTIWTNRIISDIEGFMQIALLYDCWNQKVYFATIDNLSALRSVQLGSKYPIDKIFISRVLKLPLVMIALLPSCGVCVCVCDFRKIKARHQRFRTVFVCIYLILAMRNVCITSLTSSVLGLVFFRNNSRA